MNTRVIDTSAALRLGTLAFAVALTLRGGVVTAQEGAEGVEEIVVTADPLRIIPNEDSGSSFGFNKSLLDTPRSISFVSEEQISLLGISAADDLARIVPGTYTNRRWGLQGGIDVRNTPADMYFRGMKRLNMQGHARTSLAGMDTIEVIKGPPSPIYGMGRIGGYTNLVPKLGRAVDGSILPEAQGFAQQIFGTYDKTETSFGVGGPLHIGEKQGGYFVYGLLENSDTFVEPVGVEQKLVQAGVSIDDAIGNFRLEVGTQLQNSNTSGAFMTRVTQDLVDNGKYIRGVPLVNLDLNADGQIGYAETHAASPVVGRPVSGNEPLGQRFSWPTDPATGQPYEIGSFPVVPGIPATLYNYLVAQCGGVTGTSASCPDPTGLLRAQGIGGPVPISGQLPVGFALDPRTVGVVDVDYRRAAYEKEQNADLGIFFFDLVNDVDENFTFKNQLFYDSLDSFKNSQLPYGENQDQWVVEDKFTITRRIPAENLPGWLGINMLGSLNYRLTEATITSSGGDWDFRPDIMAETILTPNSSFWNQLENDSYATGAPATTDRLSRYTETGLGMMFDIDFFGRLNLLLGARYDDAHAETTDFERFAQTCTAAQNCSSSSAFVGRVLPEVFVEGDDDATSWSSSLSYKFLDGAVVPYVTAAESSATLAAANNTITTGTILAPGGFIGSAEITEAGVKTSLIDERLFLTLARYQQTRTDISNPEDPTEGADITSSETTGIEFELKWVPSRDVFVSVFALKQKSDYIFASNGDISFDGRMLGFQDVVDPATGEVIFPAEAFIYGGKATIDMPASLNQQYLRRNGNPEEQFGVNASYQVTPKFGFNGGIVWFSEIPVTRVGYLTIPEITTVSLGATWDVADWRLQVNGSNMTDEMGLRPRNGDGTAMLMSVVPGRSYAFTVKHDF